MGLFRCQNARCSSDDAGRLIFDFESVFPICPKCKTDMRKHPNVVVRRKLIHFDPPHEAIDGKGQNAAACDPAVKWDVGAHVAFTGDPGAVTCAKCKDTDAWKKRAVEAKVLEEWDFQVEIDPAKMTLTKAE